MLAWKSLLTSVLSSSKPAGGERDPFAEVKSRVHFTVIGDLGPQLYNVNMEPDDLRERVLADVRDQLAQETGISRDDRQRIALEVADDILGHGPLEKLLADESVTEIMVNGPHDIWIGPLRPVLGLGLARRQVCDVAQRLLAGVGALDRGSQQLAAEIQRWI